MTHKKYLALKQHEVVLEPGTFDYWVFDSIIPFTSSSGV